MAAQDSPCRILVMASGFGSNFQALIDAVASGEIPNSKIISLFVNRSKAHAVVRAEKAGIPSEYYNLISHGFLPKTEKDEQKVAEARQRYDAALAEKVISKQPELIVLAGWMHIFSEAFLEPLQKAGILIINLHPYVIRSPVNVIGDGKMLTYLLQSVANRADEFDGANAIERAFDEFKAGRLTRTGIMAHYVIHEVDKGTPIMVEEIKWEGEEIDQFKDKMHAREHPLIVKATAKVVGEILTRRST
ncbi:unnamed protein product [Clonostachys solani]|uniref:phosphoribosylglycinamide formyltransferase 1 n=1 Tax=Clonostachys solani TaxID=160281 RepID=A0A9N9Z6R2_9HYPO|nr:unnamed protein product [Clonostachys solani]